MKKVFIICLSALILSSCGNSDSKSVEATYDSVGVDSSVILPPLVDSITSGPKDTLNGLDSTKPVE
jgi:PBP1b-binding outer membrane lipoprotein LpoB